MYYALDSQIRFCHLGDDFVFLDLSLGRYFGLGRDQSDAFRRFIRADGFITAQDQHILRGLIERGSLAPCNKGGSPGIKCQLESPRLFGTGGAGRLASDSDDFADQSATHRRTSRGGPPDPDRAVEAGRGSGR